MYRLQLELILETRLEIEMKSTRRGHGDLHVAEIARLLQKPRHRGTRDTQPFGDFLLGVMAQVVQRTHLAEEVGIGSRFGTRH